MSDLDNNGWFDQMNAGAVDESQRMYEEIGQLRQRLAAAEARERKDVAELQRLNRKCVLLLNDLTECRRLLREACDAIDVAIRKGDDGGWYFVKWPKFLNNEWHKDAIIQAARAAGGCDAK